MSTAPVLQRVRVLSVLAVTAFLVVSFAISRASTPRTEASAKSLDKVVVFAVPGLSLDDMGTGVVPTMDRLASHGAIGIVNVRTQPKRPDLVAAYASLGAGNRTNGADVRPEVLPAQAPWMGTTAAATVARRVGHAVSGSLVVAELPDIEALVRPDGGATLGALGDAVTASGRRTGFVGQSGRRDPAVPGDPARLAPGALAVVDSDGMIGAGTVSDTLVDSVTASDGSSITASDPKAFASAVADAQRKAAVVLVDTGDTTRLGEANQLRSSGTTPSGVTTPEDTATTTTVPSDPEVIRASRAFALARTDRTLDRISRNLAPGTLLLVVGVTPPGDAWGFTPMIATGAGISHGYLDSAATHRPALVTLTDVAPTILETIGVPVQRGMIGQPLRFRPADSNWDEARVLDALIASRASVDRTMNVLFIATQAALYVSILALILSGRRLAPRRSRVALFAALTCGAWPAATYLLRIWTPLYGMGSFTIILSWGIAMLIAAAAMRARRHPLDPVLAVSGLTVALLVLDMATGAHLQVGSFFGYMPHTAPRFTGLGNSGFALLAGASVTTVAAIVDRAGSEPTAREAAWWVAVAVAAIVVAADGAPWMGTDVGGIIALVPVLGVTMWALRGRRVGVRTLIVGAVGSAIVLGAAIGFEALRPPDQRTHIGRFFLETSDGGFFDTLGRKWSTNVADLTANPILWIVPLLAVAGVVLLRRSDTMRRLLPPGSPSRTAVIATVVVGTAGWLVNDSGVVVLAIACVQLGPLFMALLDHDLHRAPPIGRSGAPPDATGPPTDQTDKISQPGPRTSETVTKPDPQDDGREPTPEHPVVTALVPAKDRADTVAATVSALRALGRVDSVLVIDDGSTDDTAAVALEAGARVLRLPVNRGKGAAVLAGAAHSPEADVFLLIDADLAATASRAEVLLDPVLRDEADMTVGVLPSAGGKGGFGTIRALSSKAIRRACGLDVEAPLSGQRAIKADLLRSIGRAERFGLEVAMTIDVARAGARVLEVEVPMDHRHTGRSVTGFAHRGRQGVDIARALWPRLTTPGLRIGLLVGITLLTIAASVGLGSTLGPASSPGARPAKKVLIFAMNPLTFADLGRPTTPNLQRLMSVGSVGSMSVRTVARTSNDAEGFLAIGAGARLVARADSTRVVAATSKVGDQSAREYLASLTGVVPRGDFVAVGAVSLSKANEGPQAAGAPGMLADTLAKKGLHSSFVGESDRPAIFDVPPVTNRPAALAVMRSDGSADGVVEGLTVADPKAPYGIRSDPSAVSRAALSELDRSALVVVDPGDLARTADWMRSATSGPARKAWDAALRRTDEALGRIVDAVGPDTLVIVTSLRPPSGVHLQPVVVAGPSVPAGTLQSGSTKRDGLVALTDVAPTVLDALGVRKPVDVPGSPFRYQKGRANLPRLERLDRDTVVREGTYFTQSWYFIVAHWVLYLLALLVVARRPRWPRIAPWISWAALALASYPMTSFLVRLVPDVSAVYSAQILLALAAAIAFGAWVALRSRGPSHAMATVAGATVAVIVVDTWIGTPMQMSSWLGSSMHNAGRFYGVPNSTFAVLGACSIIWGVLHVEHAPRRKEALVTVACAFLVVLLSAGLPMLGADVGTLMTLSPVYALLLVVLSGRRIRLRTAVAAASAMVAVVVLAALADLARPEQSRSHLGRFADQVMNDGPSAITGSFMRKQTANFKILHASVWTDMLPIIAIFLVVALVAWRWWDDALPAGRPARAGFLAVIGAAVLGFASNDSGPIVIALFVCFLGPFVLQAIRSTAEASDPVLLDPVTGGDP